MASTRWLRGAAALVVVSSLAACGGGGGGSNSPNPPQPPPPPAARTIGGTVTGLSGSGLVLRNNGGDNLAISANGAFTFATSVTQGNAYAVTAFAQPANPTQTCVVTNGSGTVGGSNVTNVAVACTTNTYTVGGGVSGLTGAGLVLSNGSDRVTVNTNGSFTFDTAIASGSRYNILVDAAPADPVQRCSVADGSGTVSNANVTVTVTCVASLPTFAYSLNRGDGTLSSYAIDAANGQLRSRFNAKVGSRPITAVIYKAADGKQFSYVVNQDSNDISAFAMNKRSGALDEVTGSPFATGGDGPKSLVLHPTRPFLYAPNESGANIATYSIDATTGALTQTGPVSTGGQPQSFVIEATGRFAYVAAPGSSELYTYAIDQMTGALSEVANSRVAIGNSSGGIALERDGRFLYLFNPTASTISAYAINATSGVLTAITGSPFAAGADVSLAGMHPNGKFIYAKYSLPTQTTANGLAAFAIDANSGALSEITGSPFDTGANPVSMSFDPTGRYLYVGHLLVSGTPEFNVRGYIVNAATGALTTIAGSPFASMAYPSSLDVDGSGRYLYATNETTNQLTAYRIDNGDGSLSQLSGAPVNVGSAPNFVMVDDDTTPLKLSSKFVYAVDATSDATHVLRIDDDGMLSQSLSPLVDGDGPHGVTLDPKGRYAYVSNTTDDTISIYSVQSQTGALTAISASPVQAGDAPSYIAIEPSGRYAYVAAANSIVQFTIDASSGVLSSPVPTNVGQAVNVLQVAPGGRWLFATTSDSLVRSYPIDSATGELGAAASIDTGGTVSSLAVDTSGKLAYVTDATAGLLRLYSVNSQNGTLSSLGTPSFTNGQPIGVAFDPQSGFAFTADGAPANTVSMYRLSSGAISYRGSYAAGNTPIAVATDYSGKFVCVLTGSGEVFTYAINRDAATLSPVDSDAVAGATTPGALTISTHAE